jgi:hypothetical protein
MVLVLKIHEGIVWFSKHHYPGPLQWKLGSVPFSKQTLPGCYIIESYIRDKWLLHPGKLYDCYIVVTSG